MSDVARMLTPLEGAAAFAAIMERYNWSFTLTADGQLYVRVGGEHPTLDQDAVFRIIWALEPELTQLVRDMDTIRH